MNKISLNEMKQIMDKSGAPGCTFIIAGNDRKKLTKNDYANIKLLLKSYANIKYVCTKQKDKILLYVSTDTRKDEFELFGNVLVILDRLEDIDNCGKSCLGIETDCKYL